MSDINHIICTGRLTGDSTQKQVGNSTLFSFSVAVNEYSKKENKEVPSFFNVDIWAGSEKQAAYYADNLKKGTAVVVDGSLHQDRYEKDGQKQSRVVIRATNLTIVSKKGGESSGSFPSEDGFPG